MNYKTTTLLIFVLLMLLTVYLIFTDTAYGLLIMGIIVPVLIVVQVFVVLMAKEEVSGDLGDGGYEHE